MIFKLNISTLVIGKEYYRYADLLLFSLNENVKNGYIVVYITHDGGYEVDKSKYPKIEIRLKKLEDDKLSYIGGETFPYFLKKDAIKFALDSHQEGETMLHLDCDSFFTHDPLEMCRRVIETSHSEGLCFFKNEGYTFTKNKNLSQKMKTFLDGEDYNSGLLFLKNDPFIALWIYEGFILFNTSKRKIEEFVSSWEEAIRIILNNGFSYHPDSNEILYACLKGNLDMNIIGMFVSHLKWFHFLNKSGYKSLSRIFNKEEKIYEHLITNPGYNKNILKIGGGSYRGFHMKQNMYVGEKFEELFSQYKPSKILEIGTCSGGLTMLCSDTSSKLGQKCDILTLDINSCEHFREHIEYFDIKNIGFLKADIFNVDRDDINPKIKEKILNFLDSEKVIVLCDGGCKAKEFNILSNYISKGSLIMGHDYAETREDFVKNVKGKYWNWCELTNSDIQDCCEENGLENYMYNDMRMAAWVCKIKKN